MTSTAISVAGDKKYIAAMRALAVRRNDTVAALVRQALDKAYGDELRSLLVFFESSETQSPHTKRDGTPKKSVSEK